MNIIYNRTSTEDQNPENQLKDCISLANRLKLEDCKILEEKKSAFKEDSKREEFTKILNCIKNKQLNNLICWDLDRLYRNRKKLLGLFRLCKMNNCSIYSFRQGFLNEMQKIKLPTGFEFIKEMMIDNFLQFMGWIAEEESQKKSDRVKASIRQVNGVTKSYKGKKWGRKKLKKVDKQIIELYKQGKNMREITKQVYYWDKNKHKKFVSLGYVHKIASNIKEQIHLSSDVHK